jgi:urease gamma subunit
MLLYFEYKLRLFKATFLAQRKAGTANGLLLCHFSAVAVITRTVLRARILGG